MGREPCNGLLPHALGIVGGSFGVLPGSHELERGEQTSHAQQYSQRPRGVQRRCAGTLRGHGVDFHGIKAVVHFLSVGG